MMIRRRDCLQLNGIPYNGTPNVTRKEMVRAGNVVSQIFNVVGSVFPLSLASRTEWEPTHASVTDSGGSDLTGQLHGVL